MAKRFKLRILSRVIPSSPSCRSKELSNLAEHPVPSFLRLSPGPIHVDFPPATPPPSKPHRSSFKRHLSSAFLSIGCGFGLNAPEDGTESLEFKWQKEEKWHVVAKVYDETPRQKIYYSSVSRHSNDELFPQPPPPPTVEKKRRSKNRKKTAILRICTSSAESWLFSSDGGDERDEEETETLFSSSRSFSTDSSPISRRRKKKKVKRAKRSVSKGGGNVGKVKIMCRSSLSSPARLSMFKKLIPSPVDGKVTESFAVVKKSEDPYEDFKRSMMEMILEKQLFEEKELEQLLQCFLLLNSRHHHSVIVEAFTEIWEAMFCSRTSTDQRVSKAL